MPYKTASFDAIICNHVLEHIVEDTVAMKELSRVLKNDGVGLIDVPIDYKQRKTYEDSSITEPNDRLVAFGQHDHVRIYGTDFFNRMRSSGFVVEKIDYKRRLGKAKFKEHGLMDVPLLVSKKNKVAITSVIAD